MTHIVPLYCITWDHMAWQPVSPKYCVRTDSIASVSITGIIDTSV